MKTDFQDDSQPADNVFNFNKFMTTEQKFNAQKSISEAKMVKYEFCEETLEFVMEQIILMMKQFGFFVNENKVSDKDLIVLEQTIGSIMCRYHDLPHNFISIIDELVEEIAPEDVDQSEQH